jgi:hypothetical protein
MDCRCGGGGGGGDGGRYTEDHILGYNTTGSTFVYRCLRHLNNCKYLHLPTCNFPLPLAQFVR